MKVWNLQENIILSEVTRTQNDKHQIVCSDTCAFLQQRVCLELGRQEECRILYVGDGGGVHVMWEAGDRNWERKDLTTEKAGDEEGGQTEPNNMKKAMRKSDTRWAK